MKKQFLFLLTLIFVSQMALADGAVDAPYNNIDTFGKCDEQYFSVIKLKIKRPEAIPFTINAKGGKVEFSTGNLQYQAKTNTFRFATRQWENVGDGIKTTGVYRDSIVSKYKTNESGEFELDANGKKILVYDTFKVVSNNSRIGKNYAGWIDLFGWATSGYNPNAANEPDRDDPYSVCTKPYSTSTSEVNIYYNYYGYGPSQRNAGISGRTIHRDIDTTDTASRKYDWGYFNDIYCKWVGYDTTKTGTTGLDSIVFDSTMFAAKTWRTLTDTEWIYMLNTRKVENKKSAAWAYVELQPAEGNEFPGNQGGKDPLQLDSVIRGMLIFPDNFELAQARKVGFIETDRDSIAYGKIDRARKLSYKSFEALEKLGVIFLPVGGAREGITIPSTTKYYGAYWSATSYLNPTTSLQNASSAYALRFTDRVIATKEGMYKYRGYCVRLVRDLDVKQDRLVSIYQ